MRCKAVRYFEPTGVNNVCIARLNRRGNVPRSGCKSLDSSFGLGSAARENDWSSLPFHRHARLRYSWLKLLYSLTGIELTNQLQGTRRFLMYAKARKAEEAAQPDPEPQSLLEMASCIIEQMMIRQASRKLDSRSQIFLRADNEGNAVCLRAKPWRSPRRWHLRRIDNWSWSQKHRGTSGQHLKAGAVFNAYCTRSLDGIRSAPDLDIRIRL